MLKIFLVEDEIIVREGIKNNIDWEKNGYKFCGEASDGELALPLIREYKPDIVITDIRMPFMDGLELSRIIKEEMPNTKIMILSGHEEFEYAKEGIKIGVEEYLLKPISRAKLLEAVNKVAEKIKKEKEELSLENTNPKLIDRNKIKNYLQVGEKQDLDIFLDDFFNNGNKEALESKIFRQYILMDAYFVVSEFVEEIGGDKNTLPPFAIDEIMQSKESTRDYLQKLLTKALEIRTTISGNKYGSVVHAVIEYVEENYKNDDLSLNEIANHVSFSPNHLSTVFSQEQGESLIKYITDYRLQKAKELLCCTSKKTNEIALEVGYKDPHYFSALFKKMTGVSPTEYREIKN